MHKCEICGKPVQDYKPEFCCSGRECGCMGMPIEPCLCAECWDTVSPNKPVEFDRATEAANYASALDYRLANGGSEDEF